MNEPTYKIHGIERRQLKKELGELKRYVKNFWYYHQLDKDMTSFYSVNFVCWFIHNNQKYMVIDSISKLATSAKLHRKLKQPAPDQSKF